MASVCGATLAMMDAGVPINAPVAGIAMGLVKEGDEYAILTDIAGAEDHYGDMDFKVAGTKDGITALQMDIKVPNVTAGIMTEALEQARQARLFILDKMNARAREPRKDAVPICSAHLHIEYSGGQDSRTDRPRRQDDPQHRRRDGCQDRRRGRWHGENLRHRRASAEKAMQMVSDIAAVAEVGKTYLGKVVRLVDFGAFVEIFPGTDGLLHISEISENRVKACSRRAERGRSDYG